MLLTFQFKTFDNENELNNKSNNNKNLKMRH